MPGKRTRVRQAARSILRAAQRGLCYYCRRPMIRPTDHNQTHETETVDHKIPVARGGARTIDNLALACRRCNVAKGDRTADEFVAAAIQD